MCEFTGGSFGNFVRTIHFGSRPLRTRLISDIETAADLIQQGGLVAFATETVYGLGGNALDPIAVAKIFDAKQRPHFDPLIVHLADQDQLEEFVTNVPDSARTLMNQFCPGPLTLVLPKRDVIPDLVTSGLSSVAIRIPANDQARAFIKAAGVPIAAPSANRFGCVSPTTSQHVFKGLDGRIDAVLEGGSCEVGVESTVIACPVNGQPTLLRPGGLPVEEIEAVVGPVIRLNPETQNDESPQAGPGMLTRHYAPSKPIQLVDSFGEMAETSRIGVLAFGEISEFRFAVVENLSPGASLVEAAANFFAGLHRLETADIDLIVTKWFPEEGLGVALNDRLRRAAAK